MPGGPHALDGVDLGECADRAAEPVLPMSAETFGGRGCPLSGHWATWSTSPGPARIAGACVVFRAR